MSSRCKR